MVWLLGLSSAGPGVALNDPSDLIIILKTRPVYSTFKICFTELVYLVLIFIHVEVNENLASI